MPYNDPEYGEITVKVGPTYFGEHYQIRWNWATHEWDREDLPLPEGWEKTARDLTVY